MILRALVLVQHADDAAVLLRGQVQQLLHHLLRQHPVVDVVHQVTYAVDDHQVGLAVHDGLLQQCPPLLPLHGTHVEDHAR